MSTTVELEKALARVEDAERRVESALIALRISEAAGTKLVDAIEANIPERSILPRECRVLEAAEDFRRRLRDLEPEEWG